MRKLALAQLVQEFINGFADEALLRAFELNCRKPDPPSLFVIEAHGRLVSGGRRMSPQVSYRFRCGCRRRRTSPFGRSHRRFGNLGVGREN